MASYATIHSSSSEHGVQRTISQDAAPRRRTRPKQSGVAGNASWISSVVNLLNTIVGAGVLAMPHAMSNMGVVLGVFVIVWSAITSGLGLYLQTRCARYLNRGSSSFFALSQITYPSMAVIFDGAIAIKCFGVAVSYLIIIGDLMPGVVRGFTSADALGTAQFLLDRKFWITAFMVIVIPLSFLRRLDSLKYTSGIALFAIAYLVVLVVYHYGSGDTITSRGEVHWVQSQGAIAVLGSFPVIVFAYTCHQNMFSILNEIADNSPFRTTAVVTASNGLSASIYVLVAVTGYLSFGSNVIGNIVAQYRPSVFSTIGRAAIVVLVMFSYPLQVHPCRASVDAVSKWRPGKAKGQQQTGRGDSTGSPSRASLLSNQPPRRSTEEMSEVRFALITTLIIIASYLTAINVKSLDLVLAFVGSTGSTAISFILPGLFYHKISSPNSPQHQRLLKDEDDEGYEGISGSDDEAAGRPTGSDSTGSWQESWKNHLRSRQWTTAVLRKCSMALAIYGGVVAVTCLGINTYSLIVS